MTPDKPMTLGEEEALMLWRRKDSDTIDKINHRRDLARAYKYSEMEVVSQFEIRPVVKNAHTGAAERAR